MKLKIGPTFFLMLPLLLITEGHVSSVLSRLSFESLVNRSDAVLLVSKRTPYEIPFRVKYSDSIKEEFETSLYAFQIKSIISDPKELLKGKKKIDVHSSADLDNFSDWRREIEQKGRRIRISDRYESNSKNVDQEKEFLIFISFNEMVGWFSFTAGGAMESKQMIDSVRVIKSKPKPWD